MPITRWWPAIAAKPGGRLVMETRLLLRVAGIDFTLTSLSLTHPEATNKLEAFSDSVAVSLLSTVAAPITALRQSTEPMDAEHKEKQERIRELQAVIARAKNGINECRYKADCEFARACPATC